MVIDSPWINIHELVEIWGKRDDVVHKAYRIDVDRDLDPIKRTQIKSIYGLKDLRYIGFLTEDGAKRYLRKMIERRSELSKHLKIYEVYPPWDKDHIPWHMKNNKGDENE